MRKAYKKLTYADRQEIEQMSERGEKPKAIADATGVCFQTIYRELQRGKDKAILQDGSLVAPGTNGTLKFDYTGNPANATSGFHITTTVEHKQTDDGAGYGAKDFGTLTAKSGVTIPDILKALALFPNTDKTGRGFIYFRNNGERLLFRGGPYGYGGNAGEAHGLFNNPRSLSSVAVGLFSAYVDPALYA